jgi:cold shock CspA family protein
MYCNETRRPRVVFASVCEERVRMMQGSPEIAFRRFEPSDGVRSEIDRQIGRLEKFGPQITSCNVVIEGPTARHRQGALFKVNLRIDMPGRKEVAVSKSHRDSPGQEHALVAVRKAFDEAIRQIEDVAREIRGDVKIHALESRGRVAKFLAGKDCGFIESGDGREIYFHRNAVLDGAFDRLTVGSVVQFVEEEGDKGAQASTVRVLGKHGSA